MCLKLTLSKRVRAGVLNLVKLVSSLVIVAVGMPLNLAVSVDNSAYLKCTDLKIVFARGSGSEIHATNYQTYVSAFEKVLAGTGLSYSFYELGESSFGGFSYPSPGIGISTAERFKTSLGALVSGGGSYSYGESVEEGSNEAKIFINEYLARCPDSKIVLGGYSQGGQTVSRTLQKVPASKIFYAATFGDPKLYLPEGEGLRPAACENKDLSDYRAFVPDCYVKEGILGGYKPYVSDSNYAGKVGAYCRYHDIICGTITDPDNFYDGHANYKSGGVYELAAWDVYYKLFPKSSTKAKQNVAILFDRTASMGSMILKYKAEAIKTARKIMDNGGSVALYTYGDLREIEAEKLCGFNECSLEELESKINQIKLYGGDDEPESLLSASYTLMNELKWDTGANKSVIAITDASFHNPDIDQTTLAEVIKLSKEIDPVNFYILTNSASAEGYTELARETNGKIFIDEVEEDFENIEKSVLSHSESQIIDTPVSRDLTDILSLSAEKTSSSSVKLEFTTDAFKVILSLNDEILGFLDADKTEIELTDLDFFKENRLSLVPISSNGFKGNAKTLDLNAETSAGRGNTSESSISSSSSALLPKAPNSGAR